MLQEIAAARRAKSALRWPLVSAWLAAQGATRGWLASFRPCLRPWVVVSGGVSSAGELRS
jgi:hypothetical protein